MKTLKLLKSSNGWEYQELVIIRYKESYELKRSPDGYKFDEDCNYDTVIVDGVEIVFDEQFEVIK